MHYEVVFSVFLRDDTPAEMLDELRWQLGLSPQRPSRCTIDTADPLLRPSPDTHLPGGESAKLRRQLRYFYLEQAYYAWGLYARLYWKDDQWAQDWLPVAEWLARSAYDDGFGGFIYAGFFREEHHLEPTLLLFRDGIAYLCEFGGQPIALSS